MSETVDMKPRAPTEVGSADVIVNVDGTIDTASGFHVEDEIADPAEISINQSMEEPVKVVELPVIAAEELALWTPYTNIGNGGHFDESCVAQLVIDDGDGAPTMWEWGEEMDFAKNAVRSALITIDNVRVADMTDPWIYTAMQCASQVSLVAHTAPPVDGDWSNDALGGAQLSLQYADDGVTSTVMKACMQFVRTPRHNLIIKRRTNRHSDEHGRPTHKEIACNNKTLVGGVDYPLPMRSLLVRGLPDKFDDLCALCEQLGVEGDTVDTHTFRVDARGIQCCVMTFVSVHDCIRVHAARPVVRFADADRTARVFYMASGISYSTLLHSAGETAKTDKQSLATSYARHMRHTDYVVQPPPSRPRTKQYLKFRSTYGTPEARAPSHKSSPHEESMVVGLDGHIVVCHRLDTLEHQQEVEKDRRTTIKRRKHKEHREAAEKRRAEEKKKEVEKKKREEEEKAKEIPVDQGEEDRRVKRELIDAPVGSVIQPVQERKRRTSVAPSVRTHGRSPKRRRRPSASSSSVDGDRPPSSRRHRAQNEIAPAPRRPHNRRSSSPIDSWQGKSVVISKGYGGGGGKAVRSRTPPRRRRSRSPPQRRIRPEELGVDYSSFVGDNRGRRSSGDVTLSYHDNNTSGYAMGGYDMGNDSAMMAMQQRNQLFEQLAMRQQGLATDSYTPSSSSMRPSTLPSASPALFSSTPSYNPSYTPQRPQLPSLQTFGQLPPPTQQPADDTLAMYKRLLQQVRGGTASSTSLSAGYNTNGGAWMGQPRR